MMMMKVNLHRPSKADDDDEFNSTFTLYSSQRKQKKQEKTRSNKDAAPFYHWLLQTCGVTTSIQRGDYTTKAEYLVAWKALSVYGARFLEAPRLRGDTWSLLSPIGIALGRNVNTLLFDISFSMAKRAIAAKTRHEVDACLAFTTPACPRTAKLLKDCGWAPLAKPGRCLFADDADEHVTKMVEKYVSEALSNTRGCSLLFLRPFDENFKEKVRNNLKNQDVRQTFSKTLSRRLCRSTKSLLCLLL
jgi:hypothetical protein